MLLLTADTDIDYSKFSRIVKRDTSNSNSNSNSNVIVILIVITTTATTTTTTAAAFIIKNTSKDE